MSSKVKHILFLTWDGPQVTYLESLFLPIFRRLKNSGYQFHVIQFTWGENKDVSKDFTESGVSYIRISVMRYLGSIGALVTLFLNYRRIANYVNKESIGIIMPRSVFPLLLGIRLKKKIRNLKLIFDADGLPLDERIDSGIWKPNSFTYRILRDVEYQGLIASDLVLTRSYKAIDILKHRSGGVLRDEIFRVVSNGRDSVVFNKKKGGSLLRKKLGIPTTHRVIVYVGSIGPQYCLDEMLSFYHSLKKRGKVTFLILTNEIAVFNDSIKSLGKIDLQHIIIKTVNPENIPDYLNISDLGLALRKPTFSMKAVAPIKLGEYLLCGVPVLSNVGIGDTEEILNDKNCGYVLKYMTDSEFEGAVDWFVNSEFDTTELRKTGLKHFSIDGSVEKFHSAFSILN